METDDQASVSKDDDTPVNQIQAPPPTALDHNADDCQADEGTSDTPIPTLDTAPVPGLGSASQQSVSVPVATRETEGAGVAKLPMPHPHCFHGPPRHGQMANMTSPPPLTLNRLAIMSAAQHKLPISRLKDIVTRMGRHTQSSAGKRGRWYKGDNYVDTGHYSWRNMELFEDYQRHLYTAVGTVKASCKK